MGVTETQFNFVKITASGQPSILAEVASEHMFFCVSIKHTHTPQTPPIPNSLTVSQHAMHMTSTLKIYGGLYFFLSILRVNAMS